MPRKQEWKVIGGIQQLNFPYGGACLEGDETLTQISQALEKGEVSAHLENGVLGAGQNSAGNFEGEFWQYMSLVEEFQDASLEVAVSTVFRWLQEANHAR